MVAAMPVIVPPTKNYMDQKIYNDTITIESVETKNNKLTLVAHNRKRYSFWMTKKDGTDSAPYAQYKSMELKPGDSVFIGYVIEEYDTDYGRKQSNKIINFRETNEKPTLTSSQPQSPRTEPNRGQSSRSTEDSIIRQVAFKGAVEMAVAGKIDLVAIEKYTNAFERIIQGHSFPAPQLQEELPTIQTDEPPIESFEEPPYVSDPDDLLSQV